MSRGLDFACENKKCQNFDTCLTMHGPWPIAKIGDILSSAFPFDKEFRDGLEKRLSEGRTHACIPLPNNDVIHVQGIRVQAYCPRCVIVWDEDILASDFASQEAFHLAVDNMLADPPACRCGSSRITVDSIGDETLLCPSCKNPMLRQGWVVKPVKVSTP
jgi:hypothetical protein